MKAVYIKGKEDLEIVDVPVPEPGDGQVRVAVDYVGICGSDLHYYFNGANGTYVVREPLCPGGGRGCAIADARRAIRGGARAVGETDRSGGERLGAHRGVRRARRQAGRSRRGCGGPGIQLLGARLEVVGAVGEGLRSGGQLLRASRGLTGARVELPGARIELRGGEQVQRRHRQQQHGEHGDRDAHAPAVGMDGVTRH